MIVLLLSNIKCQFEWMDGCVPCAERPLELITAVQYFKPHWKLPALVQKRPRSGSLYLLRREYRGCSIFDGCPEQLASICTEQLELAGSHTQ